MSARMTVIPGLLMGAGFGCNSAPSHARAAMSACIERGPLPDPACTPGSVMTTDLAVICRTSTHGRRHVSREDHAQAFARYGLAFPQAAGAYEVDHLIPLELGGDNAATNLWPEPAEPRPGFHEKDRVEDHLHAEVCSGRMPLSEAQQRIAINWVAVWRELAERGR